MFRFRGAPVYRAGVVALTLASGLWCQSPAESGPHWQSPFSFDESSLGTRWAITAKIKGRAISDGKVMKITVERCELHRPKTFDQPEEVTQIRAAIIRQGVNSWRRYVIFGDAHSVNQTLSPDQSVDLEPFELRIQLADYPLVKGDTLVFDLVIPAKNQGRPTIATVPIYVKDPLPVTQVAAYCADLVERFERPAGPILQTYHECHDSAGRSRRERWHYPSADAPKSAATLESDEILDPVADLIYQLDPRTRKARRRKGFTSPAGFGAVMAGIIGGPTGAPPGLTPTETNKTLGTRRINGVEADGKVHTTVYPAGYQGRKEEVTVTEETWYSFRIQAQVRTIRTDPRNGDYEFQMKNIEIGEPDGVIFRVPDTYEILDTK